MATGFPKLKAVQPFLLPVRGDYVAWFTFGLATLGGLFALTLR
jgi:hypothetical protein